MTQPAVFPISFTLLPLYNGNMPDFTGFIFNIQRFSIHDGPGIRTTVFLKGCPLRCFWCHNPEGLKTKPEIQFFPDRCILCGDCLTNCSHSGHIIEEGRHTFLRENCVTCRSCVEACCAQAVQITGEEVSVQWVVDEALRDRSFYESSRGGVTLSGGEPLLQRAFTCALLEQLHAEGIHTAIETTAFFPWEAIAEVLPLVDLVMMDIKHLNSEKHRAATGVPNERILANAQRLAESGKPLLLRVPVVPTINDTTEEIGDIADFVRRLCEIRPFGADPVSLELLPFHCLAGDKYRSLGMEYQAAHLKAPGKEKLETLLEAARIYVPDAICR
jgi:pyruvate formate lyase activating enzyme